MCWYESYPQCTLATSAGKEATVFNSWVLLDDDDDDDDTSGRRLIFFVNDLHHPAPLWRVCDSGAVQMSRVTYLLNKTQLSQHVVDRHTLLYFMR